MKSLTQQNKGTSFRNLINRALLGLPINAPTHELYDLDSEIDLEDDNHVFLDDFSDPLEVQELAINIAEQHRLEISKQKQDFLNKTKSNDSKIKELEDELNKLKGGINYETPPSPQGTQTL